MYTLTATIPHRLTRAEAKRRIQDQLALLNRDYGSMLRDVHHSWNGDRLDFALTALGQSVTGHLAVDDQAVHFEVELPWLLALLAGPVKRELEGQGRRLLTGP